MLVLFLVIMSSKLFKPLHVGNVTLQNRIVLAPLTRFRSDDNHIPLPVVTEYYAQRACIPGTLLITEATLISPKTGSYPNVPGIWTQEQIEGWKSVTAAVHEKKSIIYMQLWALGRVADLEQTKKDGGENAKVISAGNIPVEEGKPKPTPLTEEDIKEVISLFAQAAKNAIKAGFDGVEIHGANGYLVDQFLQDKANNRTDTWGGSVENRSKFAVEVMRAVVEAVGAERAAIRLSPYSTFQGMGLKDPKAQFSHVTQELKKLHLSYLHLVEARVHGIFDIETTDKLDCFMDIWNGESPVLVAGGLSPEIARKYADEEYADRDIAVVFGRHFIANPDLVFRIQHGIKLNPYDRSTFYVPKEERGYITYPFCEEFLRTKI